MLYGGWKKGCEFLIVILFSSFGIFFLSKIPAVDIYILLNKKKLMSFPDEADF